MAIQRYPLLYWSLNTEAVFGIVVGTPFQAVDTHLKKLTTQLADQMRRAADHGEFIPEITMDEPRLRWVWVDVNLAHTTDKGHFPIPRTVRLRVAAVYGRAPSGQYGTCYLPYLDTHFNYYDESLLSGMIEHHTREHLDGWSPERVKNYLMPSAPMLDSVDFKPRAEEDAQRTSRHRRRLHEQLLTVADALPESSRRAQQGFPEAAWEQSERVDRLSDRLTQGGHVLLVGEHGVGKSAIIREAIRKTHRKMQGQDPGMTFWRSHAERLTGRAKYLGQWQASCDNLIQWLDGLQGVLWLTDLMSLLHTGGRGPEDSMAAYLLPALQTGRLRLIAEITPRELEIAQQKLPGFIACFDTMTVTEMDGHSSRRLLGTMAAYSQQNLGIHIDDDALDLGQRLLKRYVRDERFPGKALAFFSDTIRHLTADAKDRMTPTDVLTRFANRTGIPERFLRDDWPLVPDEVRTFFSTRLMGQPRAIDHFSDVVATFKAGLHDEGKPIATLLLAGPTGVGKTEAAKALAHFFFGAAGEPPLLRIDMSEFQHPYQVMRLIGHGDQPGKLIEHVRQKPFTVLLFDEIEKADASVFDMLLSVLDEGRLRDDRGRETDFRNTLILMTSNLGVRTHSSMGFVDDNNDTQMHDIRQFFRPEFFNRIDRVIPFAPLTAETIRRIAHKELQSIAQREGLLRRGVTITFTPQLLDHISAIGFSPRFGARPLQRAIEQHVVSALAKYLFKEPTPSSSLTVDWVDGEVRVTHEESDAHSPVEGGLL